MDRGGRFLEARRLLEAARSFEEADRVPVLIDDIGGPFFCSIFGYTLADYYRSVEASMEVMRRGYQWIYQVLGDDRPDPPPKQFNVLDVGSIAEGVVFDCEIRLPDEGRPWLSPWIIPKYRTPEMLESLEVPEPKDVMKRFKKHLYRQYGRDLEPWPIQIHPPLSAAGSLIGTDRLYVFLYKYPRLMHKFLGKLLETWLLLQEFRDDYYGQVTESIGLCDDHAGFLPENMYREFVLPYNKAIYERYGKRWRYLHMDSPVHHIARILVEELKINELDVATTEDLARVKPLFDGKVVMHGNVSNRILTTSVSLETVKDAVEYCIASAAPGGGYIFDVGGELYAGVDPGKVVFMVKYAKKVGRYPLKNEPKP